MLCLSSSDRWWCIYQVGVVTRPKKPAAIWIWFLPPPKLNSGTIYVNIDTLLGLWLLSVRSIYVFQFLLFSVWLWQVVRVNCVGSLAWRINLGNTCFDIDSVKMAWNKECIVLSSSLSLSGSKSMLRGVWSIHTRIEIQSSTLCYNYSDRETWSPLTTNEIVWGLRKNRWIVSIRLMALEKTASSLSIGIQCPQRTLVCCTYEINFHRSQAHEYEQSGLSISHCIDHASEITWFWKYVRSFKTH